MTPHETLAADKLATDHTRVLKALAHEHGFNLSPDDIFHVSTALLGVIHNCAGKAAPIIEAEVVNGHPCLSTIGGD